MRAGLMGDYNSPEIIRKTNKWTYGENSTLLVRKTSSDFIKMDDLDKVEEIVEQITIDDAFKISGIEEPYKYEEEIKNTLNYSELVLYSSTLKSINSSPFLTKEEKAKEMATLIVETINGNFSTQRKKALDFLKEKEDAGEKHVTINIKPGDTIYARIEEDVWEESYLFSHGIIEKIERINLEDINIQSYKLYNDDVPLYKPSLGLQSVNIRISIPNPDFLQSAREEIYSVFVKPKIVSIILPDLDAIQNNSNTWSTWSGEIETYEEFILDSIEEETFKDIITFIIKLKKEFGFINKCDTKYKFKDGRVSSHIQGGNTIVSIKMKKDNSSRKIKYNSYEYPPFTKYGNEKMKYRWITDTEDFCLIIDEESSNVYATDISYPSKALDEYFNMKYSKSNLEEYFYDVSREENGFSSWVDGWRSILSDHVKNSRIFVSGDYADNEEVIAIREVKNEQILF